MIPGRTSVWDICGWHSKGGPHHPPRRVDATRLALLGLALSAVSCQCEAGGDVWPGEGWNEKRGQNKQGGDAKVDRKTRARSHRAAVDITRQALL